MTAWRKLKERMNVSTQYDEDENEGLEERKAKLGQEQTRGETEEEAQQKKMMMEQLEKSIQTEVKQKWEAEEEEQRLERLMMKRESCLAMIVLVLLAHEFVVANSVTVTLQRKRTMLEGESERRAKRNHLTLVPLLPTACAKRS